MKNIQCLHNFLTVTDNHHEALIPWSRWRCGHETDAPMVVTLDHHTDVVAAFRDPLRPVEPGIWRRPADVAAAVRELKHDEHFDFAVRAGIINRAVIISHVNCTVPANRNLEVRCPSDFPEELIMLNEPEMFRALADRVLESDFLSSQLEGENLSMPYILDIDCDYFMTEKALFPCDSSFFDFLIEKSVMVTISKESDYVRLLKLPSESTLDADFIVKVLSERIIYLKK